MNKSIMIGKEADAKKGVLSAHKSDKTIHRIRDERERQLGSLGGVIGNIGRDGTAFSAESIATELGSMHTAQRAPALLALQQTHGNRYVQRVVAGIQAKLKVGQPGDKYEQEADRVADAVMRMPEPEVQRQPEEEEEEELIQTKPLAEEITQRVQRQVEPEEEEEEEIQTKQLPSRAPEIIPDVETSINSIRGGGQPLPESARAFFEPRFKHNFSRVRVHTDAKAADTARAVNARAFTRGHDVVFGAGQYAPGTHEGRRLVAHELTHFIQQKSSGNLHVARYIDAWMPGMKSFEDSQKKSKAKNVPPKPKKIGTVPKGTFLQVLTTIGTGKPAATDYCRAKESTDLVNGPYPIPYQSYKVKGNFGVGYIVGGTLELLHGTIAGKYVFNQGQLGGTLDPANINCLGHASGANAATGVGPNALSDMLMGLGFTCKPGKHTQLSGAISKSKQVMMVYLYMLKPSWRTDPVDKTRSYADLAKHYGWTKDSWKSKYVFSSSTGTRQPIDYHALTYNYGTKKWEWVTNFKPKKSDLTYDLDSLGTEPAAGNPDLYFASADQVLVSIACFK